MRPVEIKCPNCKEEVEIKFKHNHWVKWLEAECWDCGWRNKETNLDFIQPDNPFFKAIYGHDPIMEEKQRKLERLKQKEKYKEELDKKYWKKYKSDSSSHSRIKPDEEKFIRDNVLRGD